ncbi:hypothetical protein CGCVW01_v002472 [Colletotrichum viniferum]|nr:hypothetical protein CGCVW01_v002472 [Colletotrichum viniferum]
MENRQGVKDGADNVPQQQQGKETKQSWPGKHARNQKLMPSLCLCKEGANSGNGGGGGVGAAALRLCVLQERPALSALGH